MSKKRIIVATTILCLIALFVGATLIIHQIPCCNDTNECPGICVDETSQEFQGCENIDNGFTTPSNHVCYIPGSGDVDETKVCCIPGKIK